MRSRRSIVVRPLARRDPASCDDRHAEAPRSTHTLGQFFAVWGQPLTASRVVSAAGKETVFVNGLLYRGDPTAIPLKSREAVQIDIGTTVPFRSIDWSKSQL